MVNHSRSSISRRGSTNSPLSISIFAGMHEFCKVSDSYIKGLSATVMNLSSKHMDSPQSIPSENNGFFVHYTQSSGQTRDCVCEENGLLCKGRESPPLLYLLHPPSGENPKISNRISHLVFLCCLYRCFSHLLCQLFMPPERWDTAGPTRKHAMWRSRDRVARRHD